MAAIINHQSYENIDHQSYEKGKRDMFNRIYSWLKKNADNYTWYDEAYGESGMTDEFYEDLEIECLNK